MRALLICVLLLALGACAGPGGERKEELARIQYQLGLGYYRQGEYAMALERLQKADRVRPGRVEVAMLIALSHQALGQWEAAEEAYREAIERLAPRAEDEDLPGAEEGPVRHAGELYNNYGVFLCARGRFAEAEAAFRSALADPDYRTPAAAWENLGLCALRAGDAGQAAQALQRAVALDPQRRAALTALARARWELGDAEGAARALRRAEAQGPLDAASLNLALQVARRLGDERAAQAYERALRPGPTEAGRETKDSKDMQP